MADAEAGQINAPPFGGRRSPGAPVYVEPARHGILAPCERPGWDVELRENRDETVMAHQPVTIHAQRGQHLEISVVGLRADHGRDVHPRRLRDRQPGRELVDPVAIAAVRRACHQQAGRVEHSHFARARLAGGISKTVRVEAHHPVFKLDPELVAGQEVGDHNARLTDHKADAEQQGVVEPGHQPGHGAPADLHRVGAIRLQGDHRGAFDSLFAPIQPHEGVGCPPQLLGGLDLRQHFADRPHRQGIVRIEHQASSTQRPRQDSVETGAVGRPGPPPGGPQFRRFIRTIHGMQRAQQAKPRLQTPGVRLDQILEHRQCVVRSPLGQGGEGIGEPPTVRTFETMGGDLPQRPSPLLRRLAAPPCQGHIPDRVGIEAELVQEQAEPSMKIGVRGPSIQHLEQPPDGVGEIVRCRQPVPRKHACPVVRPRFWVASLVRWRKSLVQQMLLDRQGRHGGGQNSEGSAFGQSL